MYFKNTCPNKIFKSSVLYINFMGIDFKRNSKLVEDKMFLEQTGEHEATDSNLFTGEAESLEGFASRNFQVFYKKM